MGRIQSQKVHHPSLAIMVISRPCSSYECAPLTSITNKRLAAALTDAGPDLVIRTLATAFSF